MTKDTTNMAIHPTPFMLAEKLAYLVMSGTGDQRLLSEYRNISIAVTIVEDTQLKEKAV
jgi:hypothetical protein